MSSSGLPANGYIPSLDGLRAVSILIVLAAHTGLSSRFPGGFGVTVFFFLSGFLITLLLAREWDRYGSISFRAFYLRRAIRLGPPLALTILLGLGLALAGLVPGDLSVATLLSQVFFVCNYFTLHVSNLTSVDGLNVLWSLSVEEQFYLIWPAIFVLIARGRVGTGHVALLLVGILLWRLMRYFALGDAPWTIYLSTDTRFDSLGYGCLLALLMHRGQVPDWVNRPGTMIAVITLALIVLLASFLLRDPAFRATLRYTLQGLALMPIFYYATRQPDHLIFRPLNWSFVRRLGVYSYTTYLVHYILMHLLEGFGLQRGDPLVYVPLVLILSFSWAALIHVVAEQPFKPLRARLTGHPAPSPGRDVSA